MTISHNTLLDQAREASEFLEDQSVAAVMGDFEYETPAAGLTPARFIGYVELGKRTQRPYQGKSKPDADEVRLYFELNGKKHQRVVETGAGTSTFTNVITVKITKKQAENAGFYRLYKKMAYGRDSVKHMVDMLGEGFLISVVHNTVAKEGQKERVYANMKDDDGIWLIGAPIKVDPLDPDTTEIVAVPEPTVPLKLLLWQRPTQEQWDSIFIDGTRTVKDDKGGQKEVSKNWLQEDIVQNALNFEGSPLQAMLGGLADLDLEIPVAPAAEKAAVAPATTPAPAPAEKAETPAPAPAGAPDDVLAALGLD